MPDPPRDIHSLSHEEHEKLAQLVMRRQAALSLRIAAVFAVLLLGLPLFNTWYPQTSNRDIYGFPATWLFLGVLFFPITWLLSAYFIRASDRIEASCSDWRRELGLETEGTPEVHPAFVESDAEGEE